MGFGFCQAESEGQRTRFLDSVLAFAGIRLAAEFVETDHAGVG